jgi:2-polyprenyl-3-methyl-5-hydroxy-6-metoxy-1,4-benzoquinol methylase
MHQNPQQDHIFCPLCSQKSKTPALAARPDYEYGVPVTLHYLRCENPSCGLVFASQIPSPEVIQSFYSRYSTHHQAKAATSMLAKFGTASRNRKLRQIFAGRDLEQIKVLDFGCGSGNFLLHLKSLGLEQAFGYDFDPEACKCAVQAKLVAFSTEQELQDHGPYDFIFLNHVIEHLSNPQDELERQAKRLAPNGKLILRTPNSGSMLAQLFGVNWRGWETPRHLHIFNAQNITSLVKQSSTGQHPLSIQEQSTSNAMFAGIYHESFHKSFWRTHKLGKLVRHALCTPLFVLGILLNAVTGRHGEEVLLVLQAPDK